LVDQYKYKVVEKKKLWTARVKTVKCEQ
jgi:hypothetical protein